MRREKRLPGRLRSALRGGLDAVVLEDRFDRVASDVLAEALQRAADACVAPGLEMWSFTFPELCEAGDYVDLK
jgi:hypothetical protein